VSAPYPPTPPGDALRPGSYPEAHVWSPALRRPPERSAWVRWGRHVTLFAVTALSVFLTGAHFLEASVDFLDGFKLTVGLLSILLAHEMGHYLACQYYRVDATLPFFIPAPWLNPLVGTFGAVIRIKSPFPHRKALFDIGIAGPLAGFAVCLPVLILGVRESTFVPNTHVVGMSQGAPLLFSWTLSWLKGDVPSGMDTVIGPLGEAAWWGLLVTALNLVPIGQLDGGHVTYALFGRGALIISRTVWWACILMIVFIGPTWIVWSILVRLLGMRHPPTLNDSAPLGGGRVLVGLFGLAIFVVCFLPNPFLLSWKDYLQLFGWG
jgi:membrane-associated protease RseP (regulator of RpoE activity)